MKWIARFVALAAVFFAPNMTLSQTYYAPYLLLWYQGAENQAQIQQLQSQLTEMGIELGGLQRELNSMVELEQRLKELEISNQSMTKTLLEQLSKIRKEIAEVRETLNPEGE